MLRLSSGILTLLMLAASAQAQVAAPMPAMPAMPIEPAAPGAPMPAPAPVALPEVSVPTVTAPASMPVVEAPPAPAAPAPGEAVLPITAEPTPETPAVQQPVVEAPVVTPDPNGEFSYGKSDISLLFTSRQIDRMKSVLSIYETARRNQVNVPITVVEQELGEELKPVSVEEPASYPVFTLKSIAYRAPNDWTVWIGNLRITPRNNEQEVRVLGVSANRAQFLWKPAYAEALQQRDSMKLFAPTTPVKHKMTRVNTALLDRAAGQVTFTLLPNQSFAAGYMATFEGKIASPALPKIAEDAEIPEVPAAQETSPSSTNNSAENPANLDALLRSQQKSGPVNSLFRRSMTAPQNPAPAPTN